MSIHLDPAPGQQQPMSRDEMADLAKKLDAQWREAKAWWAPIRLKARKARDYYHMLQWTETQQAALKEQGRPAIVINLIGKAVDNICGRERATRYDWKAAPVGQNDVLASAAMTHGLKSIARQTEAKYRISEAFENAVLGPMGWLEVGYDDSDPEQSPEVVDAPDPDEMYFDPHSRQMDFKDAKYLIRRRIVDLEDAIALAPHLEDELRALASGMPEGDGLDDDEVIEGDYNNRPDPDEHRGSTFPLDGDDSRRKGRPRLALREHQWWVREEVEWLETPDGQRHYLDDLDTETYYQLVMSGAQEASGRRRCFYQALVTGPLVLYKGKFPIPFGRFTYVGLFAKRDRQGRPYGLVERAIPCQEEVNVARSKLNESLRSRHLIYQRGALGPGDKTEADIAAMLERGNFVLGVDSVQGLVFGSDRADVQAWLELMREAKAEIDAVFGNNDAAYGDKSQEISGVAQQVRIQQQAQNLGGIFDNLRYARKQVGEMLLVVLQKHTSPQKLLRIIGASLAQGAAPVRMTANGAPAPQRPLDLSWLHPLLAGPIYQNRFDVEMTDSAETATERQAEMQQRMDLLGLVPDAEKSAMLPETLRATDWDGAEAMAAAVEESRKAQAEAQANPPRIQERANIDSAEMTPYEVGQLLAKDYGITPDPGRQPGQPTSSQAKAETAAQAQVMTTAMKHDHEARQGAISRTHDELMALQGQEHALHHGQVSHDQQLEQQAFTAQQTPPAGPEGG